MKSVILAAVAAATLAIAGHAAAAITIGDTLDVQYNFPDLGSVYDDSGNFLYTGAGQTIGTQYGLTTVTLNDDSVVFGDCVGGCGQTPADWNGPVVIDVTNNAAFSGWAVLSDTIGISGSYLTGGAIGVNWQGATIGASGGQVVVGASAVPEPATWALMLVGFAGLGAGVRARRRALAA